MNTSNFISNLAGRHTLPLVFLGGLLGFNEETQGHDEEEIDYLVRS